MKRDFCRFCGSKKLQKEKRDIFLESQKKMVKDVSIWICENCGEEFLDDASIDKLYNKRRVSQRNKSLVDRW